MADTLLRSLLAKVIFRPVCRLILNESNGVINLNYLGGKIAATSLRHAGNCAAQTKTSLLTGIYRESHTVLPSRPWGEDGFSTAG